MPFNPADADFNPEFRHNDMVVVCTKSSRGNETPIVVYNNEYKGKKYVHIRELWCDANDVWNMGKGVSVPFEQAGSLLSNIGKLASPTPVATAANKAGARKIKAA